MIGLLIAAHGNLGESLIQCATYVLGRRPEHLHSLDLTHYPTPEAMLDAARAEVAALDSGAGVLVLSDIYGATPCNVACKLMQPGRVEVVAGVNLPMLLKVITYQGDPLSSLAERAARGGQAGTFHVEACSCDD